MNEPWYKRWWVALAALALGLVGGITAVIGKVTVKRADAEKQSKKETGILNERLKDKSAVTNAKDDAIEAQADLQRAEVIAQHKEAIDAIEEKNDLAVSRAGNDPDAAAELLQRAIERATTRMP